MIISRRWITLLCVTALALAALFGHRWLALGWNAWRFPTAEPQARTQVVVGGGRAYVAAGAAGIEMIDLATRRSRGLVPPVAPADRIDDVALADGLLFALDATPPGHLIGFSLADPDRPVPVGEAVPVPVGPFSGVSAAAGVVIVSGGTSQLTAREYDEIGRFGPDVVTADFGRGQPDVAVRPDGRLAAVSTHTFGPDFALTLVEIEGAIERRPLALRPLGRLALRDAGFTPGGFKPAHFPLVAAWHGDRLVVADGGGLSVIDVADPRRPRLLAHDALPRPTLDVAVAGGEVDVLGAGARPAVFRYRLDRSGRLLPIGRWDLPAGHRPAALARFGADLLITQHGHGWQIVPPGLLTF